MNVLQNTNISGNSFEPIRSGPVPGSFPTSEVYQVNNPQMQTSTVPGSFNQMQNNYVQPLTMNIQPTHQANNQAMPQFQGMSNCQNGM
jgi:hypothetical protein